MHQQIQDWKKSESRPLICSRCLRPLMCFEMLEALDVFKVHEALECNSMV
jgi:7-keto-8-aminopelargonate synthetase-like enzyme